MNAIATEVGVVVITLQDVARIKSKEVHSLGQNYKILWPTKLLRCFGVNGNEMPLRPRQLWNGYSIEWKTRPKIPLI